MVHRRRKTHEQEHELGDVRAWSKAADGVGGRTKQEQNMLDDGSLALRLSNMHSMEEVENITLCI